MTSSDLCKACLLLEGLNKGLPQLAIGKKSKEVEFLLLLFDATHFCAGDKHALPPSTHLSRSDALQMKLRQAAGSVTGTSDGADAMESSQNVSAAVESFPAPTAKAQGPSIEPLKMSARRVANDW